MTKNGSYTANFVKIPDPIPNEYLVALFGIIATTIIGWSIPNIISGLKSRREINKLNFYHKKNELVYDDKKLDENDIPKLDKLKYKFLIPTLKVN